VATTTYLTNPVVTIAIAAGSPVDFSDQCTALELTSTKESLEVTAFGDTARKYTSGLQNNTVTMTMFLSYGATEVESLQAGVGASVHASHGASERQRFRNQPDLYADRRIP
jgi:hypothetical protein